MLHELSEAKETTPASAARGLEVLDEVDVLQSEKTKLQQQLQNYQTVSYTHLDVYKRQV